LRVIFAAFLIATVGRSLVHTPLRKLAAGSRSATGRQQPRAGDSHPGRPAPAPAPRLPRAPG
jgi:hypothetical protein